MVRQQRLQEIEEESTNANLCILFTSLLLYNVVETETFFIPSRHRIRFATIVFPGDTHSKEITFLSFKCCCQMPRLPLSLSIRPARILGQHTRSSKCSSVGTGDNSIPSRVDHFPEKSFRAPRDVISIISVPGLSAARPPPRGRPRAPPNCHDPRIDRRDGSNDDDGLPQLSDGTAYCDMIRFKLIMMK